jgi:hypothetical protein
VEETISAAATDFCSSEVRAAVAAKRFIARGFRGEDSTTRTLQRYSYAPVRRMFVDHVAYKA